LKGLFLVLSVLAVVGLCACGGGSGEATSTGPLALAQRVPNEDDAPDSRPDPVEQTQTASTRREFVEKMGDAFVNPTKQERKEFLTLPFVGAIRATRFFPSAEGAEHSKDDAHVFSLVVQFETPDAAKRMADFFHTDGLRPCPKSCAFSVSEFDVSEIPDATGVRRYASEEAVQAAGTSEDRPYDSYEIYFPDGNFAYFINLGGPPGTTAQNKAEEIAKNLYDRVHGAPVADAGTGTG
jgi:hypothetical protein